MKNATDTKASADSGAKLAREPFTSAARLLAIVDELRTLPNDLTFGAALARTLRLPNFRRSGVLAHGMILDICEQARRDLSSLNGVTPELYVSSIENLESRILSISHRELLQSVRQHFDDAILTSLRFCADVLNHRDSEQTLSDAELARIGRLIEELEKDIAGAEIDDRLKALLVVRVHELREATVLYRAGGVSVIQESLDAFLGSLVRGAVTERAAKKATGRSDEPSSFAGILEKVKTVQEILLNSHHMLHLGLPAAAALANLLT